MKGYEREYLEKKFDWRSNYDIGPVITKEHIHKLESETENYQLTVLINQN